MSKTLQEEVGVREREDNSKSQLEIIMCEEELVIFSCEIRDRHKQYAKGTFKKYKDMLRELGIGTFKIYDAVFWQAASTSQFEQLQVWFRSVGLPDPTIVLTMSDKSDPEGGE